MGRTSFVNTWKKYTPFILTSKPRTDLCWTCQKNTRKIYESRHETTARKTERLATQIQHLYNAQNERANYQAITKEAKSSVESNPDRLGEHQPCSRPGAMSYSFDFAQQVGTSIHFHYIYLQG